MTPLDQILRDLLTSPSTESAITDHTDIPTDQVTTILRAEEKNGLVECRPLHSFFVWSLTAEGSELAKALPPTPKFY